MKSIRSEKYFMPVVLKKFCSPSTMLAVMGVKSEHKKAEPLL